MNESLVGLRVIADYLNFCGRGCSCRCSLLRCSAPVASPVAAPVADSSESSDSADGEQMLPFSCPSTFSGEVRNNSATTGTVNPYTVWRAHFLVA